MNYSELNPEPAATPTQKNFWGTDTSAAQAGSVPAVKTPAQTALSSITVGNLYVLLWKMAAASFLFAVTCLPVILLVSVLAHSR